jgi:hypothetical protein
MFDGFMGEIKHCLRMIAFDFVHSCRKKYTHPNRKDSKIMDPDFVSRVLDICFYRYLFCRYVFKITIIKRDQFRKNLFR